ncbi:MAG TPA: ABC transporter permease, partial [Puia sp.]|nr:ABC transporter permease [Puia sp.]
MIKFFRFEVRYWLKRPMLYIFFLLFALLAFGSLTSDYVQIGSGKGITHANAPLVIQTYFAILSLIGLIMMTSFFNATATRDYSYGMDQIIFASPIKKTDFFFGKFLGAFFISTLPYIGITLAAWISPYMPWIDAQHFGPFSWPANLYGFLLFSVCNTFFGGAIIYAFAIYFRNPIISYLASFGIIILYVIATTLTKDVENQHLAILLDPLGSRAFNVYTQYWSPAQRNSDYISITTGVFLLNRILWAAVGLVILLVVYRLFDFTQSRQTARKRQQVAGEKEESITERIPAVIATHRPVAAWRHQFTFELRSIIRNNAFIILTAIGLLNLITDFIFNTGNFGQRYLPVTYSVIELIDGDMLLFIMAFIVFYSGYIVFREKEVRMDEIVDTTPVKSGMIVTTKLAAVLASIAIILALSTVVGMIYQLIFGFTRFQVGLYIRYFAMDLLTYFFILVMAYLLQL